MTNFPAPFFQKNDRKAALLIWTFSIIVFAAVVALGAIKLKIDVGFDVHVFAKINAVINSLYSSWCLISATTCWPEIQSLAEQAAYAMSTFLYWLPIFSWPLLYCRLFYLLPTGH